MTKLRILSGLLACGLAAAGCRPPAPAGEAPGPTRGVILISLDALRPDHLGTYGYRRPTSPFLDSLAGRGAVFERAVAQYPSTLASHLSIFTGLYPQEHGVFRPETVLAEAIETVPERLRAAGLRTAGHTEGGFMSGGYGFARGFESFTDTRYQADTDVERTFRRGVEFLEGLAEGERFFLFLHTYSIHDPYTPPPDYAGMFWSGEPPPGAFASNGQNLRAANRGELAVTPEIVDWLVAGYDGSIRYVDDVLAQFWQRVEQLGLADETTLIVTSDHGEAFYEHGKLAHTQVYPEDLAIPLIVVHPGLERGVRVPALVEAIDLAPTLCELAGVEAPAEISGRSLMPYLADASARLADEAYGENLDRDSMRALFREQDGTVYQLILFEPLADPGGTWVLGSTSFHATRAELEFEAQSFHVPRRVSVRSDGEEVAAFDTTPGWQPVRIELPLAAVGREVVLETPGCDSPLELGVGHDPRCLSFQLRGIRLRRTELYDLSADPAAQHDIARDSHDLTRRLLRRLSEYRFTPVAESRDRELSEETLETLRALGYIR